MKTYLKKIILICLKISISSTVIVLLFRRLNWAGFIQGLQDVNIYIYIAAFITYTLGMIIRSYKLGMSLKIFNFNIGLKKLLFINYISIPFNLLLPSGVGEDISKSLMLNDSQQDIKKVAASVIFDKVTNLFALVLLANIGCIIVYFLRNYIITYIPVILLGIIGFALWLFNTALMQRLLSCFPEKYSNLLIKFYSFMNDNVSATRKNVAAGIFIHSIITVSTFYLIGLSIFGSSISFVYFIAFVPLIMFLQFVPLFFGGIGAREIGFVYLFGLIGFEKEKIILIPLIYYGIFGLNILIGLFLFFFFKPES